MSEYSSQSEGGTEETIDGWQYTTNSDYGSEYTTGSDYTTGSKYSAIGGDTAWDAASDKVEQTWDAAVETVEQAYDAGTNAVTNYDPWTTDGTAPPVPPGCDDPEDPELEKHLAYAALHIGGEIALHYIWPAASTVAEPVTAVYLIYEVSWAVGDAAAAEYYKRLCGEHYEYLAQLAQAGECPQAFQGVCNADHDGGGAWYGPLRMNAAEATDDVNAHVYAFPDHRVDKGDATVYPTGADKYAAGCDADHGGTSWSGPERDTFEEAADDLVAHLGEWPDHRLDTDYGQPGARVNTRTRDPWSPGGYR